MWVLDLVTDTWAAVVWEDENPGSRSSHACAPAGDAGILLFGGIQIGSSGEELMGDLWQFSLTSEAGGYWAKLKPSSDAKPSPRSDHSLVAMPGGDTYYLTGGCNERVAQPNAWRLKLDAGQWVEVSLGEPEHAEPSDEAIVEDLFGAGGGGEGGKETIASMATTNSSLEGANGTDVAQAQERGPRLPSARCAHTSAAVGTAEDKPRGVLIFGGRVSISRYPEGEEEEESSQEEAMWQSLADTWILREDGLKARLSDGVVNASLNEGVPSLWQRERTEFDSAELAEVDGDSDVLLLNRSDHASVLHDGHLYVFGGLFTDLEQRTVYIMKDLVRLRLEDYSWKRLEWGPQWRFGHTMVNDPERNRFVLYGGAGGVDVFDDIWAYHYDTGVWEVVDLDTADPDYPTLLMTILMAGAGFVLCMCMLVSLLFLRTSRRLLWHHRTGAQGAQGGGQAVVDGRTARGAGEETISALPVFRWGSLKDELDTDGGRGGDGGKSAPADNARSHADAGSSASHAAPAGAPAGALREPECGDGVDAPGGADDDRSLDANVSCVVCLCEFEDDEDVVRLPCRHVFHAECIHRWLRQDATCPQCRHRISGADGKAQPAVVVGVLVGAGDQVSGQADADPPEAPLGEVVVVAEASTSRGPGAPAQPQGGQGEDAAAGAGPSEAADEGAATQRALGEVSGAAPRADEPSGHADILAPTPCVPQPVASSMPVLPPTLISTQVIVAPPAPADRRGSTATQPAPVHAPWRGRVPAGLPPRMANATGSAGSVSRIVVPDGAADPEPVSVTSVEMRDLPPPTSRGTD